MSNPLVTIHGPEWTKILQALRDTIALLALHDELPEAEIDNHIQQYVTEVQGQRGLRLYDDAHL